MFGNRFEKEKRLVKEALENEVGEKEIRIYLSPLVKSLVDEYISQNPNEEGDIQNLSSAAWSYLDIAMKRYIGRVELMELGKNDVYYFPGYFNWFARQGILDYVKNRDSRK